MHMGVCVGHRTTLGVISQMLCTPSFEKGFLTGLKLTLKPQGPSQHGIVGAHHHIQLFV